MALPSSSCQKDAIAGEDPQIMLFGKMIQVPGLANVIEIKEEEESLSPRGFDEVGASFGMSSSGSDEDEDNQSFVLNQAKQQPITSSENLSRDSENHSRNSHSEIEEKAMKKPEKLVQCPRCNSLDTKFCYFNNYNVNQPRHFCKHCQRYWTAGGTLRNVPIGAGKRKSKHTVRQALSPNCLLYRREERGDTETMATSCTTNMPPPTSLDLFGGTQLDRQSGFTKLTQRHSFPSDVRSGLGESRSSQPFLQYRQPGLGSRLDLQSELKASQVISNRMFPKSNPVKTLQNDESSTSHMTLRTEFSETSEIKSSHEVGYTGVNGPMAVSHGGYNGSSNKNDIHDLPLCSSPLHERTTEISSVSDSEVLSSNDKAFLGRPSRGCCGGQAVPALEGMQPYLYNMYWSEMPQQAVASNAMVTGDMLWPWAPFAATPVLGPQGWRLTCFGAMAPTTSVPAGNHENTTATVTAMLGKRPAQDETEAASSVSKTSRLLDPEASASSSTQSKTSLLSHSSGSTITVLPWK